jgi:hypothetical protein
MTTLSTTGAPTTGAPTTGASTTDGTRAPGSPAAEVAHLTPELWERATRRLLAKALGEFAHERLITPRPSGRGDHDGRPARDGHTG